MPGALAPTTSTTTTTLPPPTTTTTTLPEPKPCTLREEVVRHDLHRAPADPAVGGGSNSTGDMLWKQETQLTVNPSARHGHAMAYLPPQEATPGQEARPGQTVLFGGFDGTPQGGCVLGDTWIWNGSAWDRRDVPGPPVRYGHAMAYDGTGIVVFGGYNGEDDLGDTWTWNGSAWAQATTSTGLPVPGPSARSRTSMAYNAAEPANAGDDHAVLFGGDQIVDGKGRLLGDTWRWNPGARSWSQHAPVASPTPGPMPRWPTARAQGWCCTAGGTRATAATF